MSHYPPGPPYAPYPQQPPHGSHEPPTRRSNLKWWLIGIGSALAVMLLCCSGFGVFIYNMAQAPKGIAVETDAPLRVTVGEQFSFTITVTNTASDVQSVEAIDVSNAYLQGVAIQSTSPAYSESFPVPFADMTSYVLSTRIPPGQSADITINATALQPGDYVGPVDVCINNDYQYVTHTIRTIVEQPNASAADSGRDY